MYDPGAFPTSAQVTAALHALFTRDIGRIADLSMPAIARILNDTAPLDYSDAERRLARALVVMRAEYEVAMVALKARAAELELAKFEAERNRREVVRLDGELARAKAAIADYRASSMQGAG